MLNLKVRGDAVSLADDNETVILVTGPKPHHDSFSIELPRLRGRDFVMIRRDGRTYRLVGDDRSSDSIAFDVPRSCRITRPDWKGGGS